MSCWLIPCNPWAILWKWKGTFCTFGSIHYVLLCSCNWLPYKGIEGRPASFIGFILIYYLPFTKHFAKQSALQPFYYLFSSPIYTSPMRPHGPRDRKTDTVVRKKSLPCTAGPLVALWHILWESWNRSHWKLNWRPCYDPHCPEELSVSPVSQNEWMNRARPRSLFCMILNDRYLTSASWIGRVGFGRKSLLAVVTLSILTEIACIFTQGLSLFKGVKRLRRWHVSPSWVFSSRTIPMWAEAPIRAPCSHSQGKAGLWKGCSEAYWAVYDSHTALS